MSFEIRELSEQPQRALLVGIGVPGDEKREREALLAELEDLVSNLGIGIAESRVIWTRELQAKYLCGIGKAEEIRELAENLESLSAERVGKTYGTPREGQGRGHTRRLCQPGAHARGDHAGGLGTYAVRAAAYGGHVEASGPTARRFRRWEGRRSCSPRRGREAN